MYFIYDALTFFFLALLFSISYFAIQKVISLKSIASLKIRSLILEGFVGLYFGAIILVLKLTMVAMIDSWHIPLFIIVSLTLLSLRGPSSAVVSTFPPLIYYLFTNEIDTFTYILIGMNYFTIFVYEIIVFNTKKIWAELGAIISVLVFAVVILLIMLVGFNHSFSEKGAEESIVIPFILPIFYYPTKLIIETSISANILFNTTKYVHLNYFRYSLYSKAILDEISEKKITKGIYMLFKFGFDDQKNRHLNFEIQESILQTMASLSGRNSVQFNVNEKTYGIFKYFEKDEEKKITAKQMEDLAARIVEEANISYVTNHLFNVPTKVKAAVSFYGIQSNSINELETKTMYSLSELDMNQKEKLNVFNYGNYKKTIKDAKMFVRMDKALNLNNYMTSFVPIYGIKDDETKFNYVDIHTEYEHELLESLDELLRFKKWNITFDRYFAVDALNNWKNEDGDIYIKFSPITAIDYDFAGLVKKLKKMKLKYKKIHFVISARDLSVARLKTLIKRTKLYNLNIALIDSHIYSSKSMENLDLDNIFVYEKFIDQTNLLGKFTYSVFDISTEASLKKAMDKGIDLIGGKLFNYGNKYTIFNKQSKMYIEDILSERERG